MNSLYLEEVPLLAPLYILFTLKWIETVVKVKVAFIPLDIDDLVRVFILACVNFNSLSMVIYLLLFIHFATEILDISLKKNLQIFVR